MSSFAVLLSLFLAAQPTGPTAGQSPSAALEGVWEGPRKRVRLGACQSSGPGRTTLALWTEADGTLRGRFTRASGAKGEMDLKGRLEGQKVVFETGRLANCNGAERRYTITLEGAVATDADGKRVLTMTGVDQACPSTSCSFRDEYALTWMRAAPAPIAR